MRIKNSQKRKLIQRQMRHGRVRAKISGTRELPRLSVFRSAKHIGAQLIDDLAGKTIVGATDLEVKEKAENKVKMSEAVGRILAMKAVEKGIKKVKFDRGGYLYHGRIKALADGAREGGLEF